jgi:hypothetical protein
MEGRDGFLVQFALLGSSGLEQYAILLVRVAIGLFFAISGANKLHGRRPPRRGRDVRRKRHARFRLAAGSGAGQAIRAGIVMRARLARPDRPASSRGRPRSRPPTCCRAQTLGASVAAWNSTRSTWT